MLGTANVFYTRSVSPYHIYPLYEQLHKKFMKPAIKVHSGERGNLNYLTPDYLSKFLDKINGIIVETNSAYEGSRNTTKEHMQLMIDHGWTRYPVDILDSDSSTKFDINNGLVLNCNIVGSHMSRYNSCVVISHFKAHPMGGFGGALKQLSIGFASGDGGKQNIHGYGSIERGKENIKNVKSENQEAFLKAMADAAKSIHSYFAPNIIYVTIMKDISTSCDCDANAPLPQMEDIGMLVSTDPVAIDAAALYLLTQSEDPNKEDVLKVIDERQGLKIIEFATSLKFGTNNFKLIEVEFD